ncbi:Peptidase family M1 [Flavobacterium xanthum]|uniref:Peptidase family M1 n=2 Tax=Flavobacteriaceae TaxID=49546 RepID=A0A1M6XYK5_9FLAO|nr:Peptidase family M1 [Flavobacterium xanthum]
MFKSILENNFRNYLSKILKFIFVQSTFTMKKQFCLIFISFAIFNGVKAQGLLENKGEIFTKQDTLRGSITKERAWWDVKNYHLDIKVNPADSTISGSNTIKYQVVQEYRTMQIDLQSPMQIYKVIQDGKSLKFRRDGNAFFVELIAPQVKDAVKDLIVFYGGKPKVAVNPPWDGGITWKKDSNGNPFIASSCQGLGASVWWPNKDHMYDEVENMLISVNIPKNLTNVSNGRLLSVKQLKDGTKTYNWYVSNPINNYGVNINVGDYVSFSEKYKGEKGDLDCTYYVLRDNLAKAKKQFQDVPKMLKAFEHWFGPYPFYEDSFKLVEAPYLGMEHQSSVTYGNKFQNGYLGRDLSGTGWGLKFDFIIIHESGHEWFANNITYKDIADMWIHESFTNYSESLFVEYYYGKEAGFEYVRGTRKNIENDKPIIGKYDVNNEGSGDMYSKGANMLHTLRQLVNNDEKWRGILRGLNSTFYHQTVTTKQIEDYLSQQIGINLSSVFNQYLRDTRIPTLEYFFKDNQLGYRWTNCVAGFNMPVKITLNGKEELLQPETEWKNVPVNTENSILEIDKNFYVASFNITE